MPRKPREISTFHVDNFSQRFCLRFLQKEKDKERKMEKNWLLHRVYTRQREQCLSTFFKKTSTLMRNRDEPENAGNLESS